VPDRPCLKACIAKLALMFTGALSLVAPEAHALMARKRPKNKSLRTIFFQKMRIRLRNYSNSLDFGQPILPIFSPAK